MFSIADMSFLQWVLVSGYVLFGFPKIWSMDSYNMFFALDRLDPFCSLAVIFYCQRTSLSVLLLA